MALGKLLSYLNAICSMLFLGEWHEPCKHILLMNRMAAHAIELMTAGSDEAESLLCEEQYNLGELSIQELHRLVYAQVLSSHAFTWQVSACYSTF